MPVEEWSREEFPASSGLIIGLALILIVVFVIGFKFMETLQSSYCIRGEGSEDSYHRWVSDWWVYNSSLSTEVKKEWSIEPTKIGYIAVGGKQLGVNSTLHIEIIMGKPYFSYLIKEDVSLIYPETYGYFGTEHPFGENIPQTSHDRIPLLQVWYTTTISPWTFHVPVIIKVEKIGDQSFLIKRELEFFELGGSGEIEVVNPVDGDERVRISVFTNTSLIDLGDMVFTMVGGETFEGEGVVAVLDYDGCPTSFSNYWFGASVKPIANNLLPEAWFEDTEIRWTVRYINGRTKPMPLVYTRNNTTMWVDPSSLMGWNATMSYRGVFKEVDYDPQPATMKDVLGYLRGLHQTVDINLYGEGISICEGRMKIFVPRDKISWSFKLEVSSELADTYVS